MNVIQKATNTEDKAVVSIIRTVEELKEALLEAKSIMELIGTEVHHKELLQEKDTKGTTHTDAAFWGRRGIWLQKYFAEEEVVTEIPQVTM